MKVSPTNSEKRKPKNQTTKYMSLYKNMNKRKEAGTSRPKSQSTVDPKTYGQMKAKKGGFAPKKK
jgi:hypothetical protein